MLVCPWLPNHWSGDFELTMRNNSVIKFPIHISPLTYLWKSFVMAVNTWDKVLQWCDWIFKYCGGMKGTSIMCEPARRRSTLTYHLLNLYFVFKKWNMIFHIFDSVFYLWIITCIVSTLPKAWNKQVILFNVYFLVLYKFTFCLPYTVNLAIYVEFLGTDEIALTWTTFDLHIQVHVRMYEG